MFEHRDEPRARLTPGMLWTVLVEPWSRLRERSAAVTCPGCGTPVADRARRCDACDRDLPPEPFQVQAEPISLERIGVYLLMLVAAVLVAAYYASPLVSLARRFLSF